MNISQIIMINDSYSNFIYYIYALHLSSFKFNITKVWSPISIHNLEKAKKLDLLLFFVSRLLTLFL